MYEHDVIKCEFLFSQSFLIIIESGFTCTGYATWKTSYFYYKRKQNLYIYTQFLTQSKGVFVIKCEFLFSQSFLIIIESKNSKIHIIIPHTHMLKYTYKMMVEIVDMMDNSNSHFQTYLTDLHM
jgi:hypothetical protein